MISDRTLKSAMLRLRSAQAEQTMPVALQPDSLLSTYYLKNFIISKSISVLSHPPAGGDRGSISILFHLHCNPVAP